jgi:deoxyadenosine/deoxycytidine kinase
MLVDDGTMDKMEMDLHNMILEMFNYEKPDLLIFLDTNYELAYQRLRERSRDGELKISMEYLEKLENMYKQQLTTLANNIINVDGSLTEIEIGEKCADLIKGFV